jgi:uncharacterized RDD family membrane protein YckC
LPNQVNHSPSWKQEVNQRVAAHKERKIALVPEPAAGSEAPHNASSRAAAAAARVAARYAKAPSYSEILADDARAAVRAAEAASKAAQQAQAAAESLLAGLEAANLEAANLEAADAPEFAWEVQTAQDAATGQLAVRETEPDWPQALPAARMAEAQTPASEEFEVRWESDLPVRPTEKATVHATHGTETPDAALDELREPAWTAGMGPASEAIEIVEPAQPIYANLIEFPREIVATRRVRPRLAEGPGGASEGQLSIFEVDPGSISIEPAADAVDGASAPPWSGAEWSGIELDATPGREFFDHDPKQSPAESATEAAQAGETPYEPDALNLAPLNLRLMAAVVDSSLVMGAFLVGATQVAPHVKAVPSIRGAEVAAAVGLALICALYHLLFSAVSPVTPGMLYAGISPCTFDGKRPSRAQRLKRLGAMLLSVVPVGLGVLWAVFDDDHMSWHDRLSQTYLRKC